MMNTKVRPKLLLLCAFLILALFAAQITFPEETFVGKAADLPESDACEEAGILFCGLMVSRDIVSSKFTSMELRGIIDETTLYPPLDNWETGDWNEDDYTQEIQYPGPDFRLEFAEDPGVRACGLEDVVEELREVAEEIAFFRLLKEGGYYDSRIHHVDRRYLNEEELPEFDPTYTGRLAADFLEQCSENPGLGGLHPQEGGTFADIYGRIPTGSCAIIVNRVIYLQLSILERKKEDILRSHVREGRYAPFTAEDFNEGTEVSDTDIFEGAKRFARNFDSVFDRCRVFFNRYNGDASEDILFSLKQRYYGYACSASKSVFRQFNPPEDAPPVESPIYGNEQGICLGISSTVNRFFSDGKFVGGDCKISQREYADMIRGEGCFEVPCQTFSELLTAVYPRGSHSPLSETTRFHREQNQELKECMAREGTLERRGTLFARWFEYTNPQSLLQIEEQEINYFDLLDRILDGETPMISIVGTALGPSHSIFAHSCDDVGLIEVFDPNFPEDTRYLRYTGSGTFMEPTFLEPVIIRHVESPYTPRNICHEESP